MNYQQLKEAIEGYVERDDIMTKAQHFLRLLESHLNLELASVPALQNRSQLTTNQGVNIVAGLGKVYSVSIGGKPLDYTFETCAVSGSPMKYSVAKDTLYLFPAPTSEVVVDVLHSSLLSPLLTEEGNILDTDTNWILTQFPHIYVYGLLWQVYMFLDNPLADKYLLLLRDGIKKFVSHHATQGGLSNGNLQCSNLTC